MSLKIDGEVIHLEGDCPVEAAEPLAAALESGAARIVDISQAQRLHGAVVQALLHFRPVIQGSALEPFLSGFVGPALADAGLGSSAILSDRDV